MLFSNARRNSITRPPLPFLRREARFGLLVVCAFCLSFYARPATSQNGRRAETTRSPERIVSLASSRDIPDAVMLRLLEAEDERRWDADLSALLTHGSAGVRRRAAVAAGRIGDERSVGALTALLRADRDTNVRAAAAFALGETESATGADALIEHLNIRREEQIRARAVEALGKIAAALPQAQTERKREIGAAILSVLNVEASRRSRPSEAVILAALTAALRARPENAALSIANFLSAYTPEIRSTALNSLARLRARDANQQIRELLVNDSDPIVRANAARVLGATEDRAAVDALIGRASNDPDGRVRVSAIRALGTIKDLRAVETLNRRARTLFETYNAARTNNAQHPAETGELLEVASALGSLLANTADDTAIAFLRRFREAEGGRSPEIEIAFARIAPTRYLSEPLTANFANSSNQTGANFDWRMAAAVTQGLGEMAKISGAANDSAGARAGVDAQRLLRGFLTQHEAMRTPAPVVLALPDALRAVAAFKPTDLGGVLTPFLSVPDVFARAAAAELIGELPASEAARRALAAALPAAMRETANDATLAMLDALGKQQHAEANAAIQSALTSRDHLVRRRAISLLRAANAGDFSAQTSTVSTTFGRIDYERTLARRPRRPRAVVTTDKGVFTIELLADEAPLTVDNFIRLAERGRRFDNSVFHRVVPNFVIQGGDYTRGDGNGGPPYQIRCEINDVPYERGAVGMALSGKDTGGSQWFVTHSPQPHLDGGYTVFGHVTEGMDVVDRITRGDRILRIRIIEDTRTSQNNLRRTGNRRRRR